MYRYATIFRALLIGTACSFVALGCGKSDCKRYQEKFCADETSAMCAQAKTRSQDWSADKCRIELNQIEIEEQAKKLSDELK